MSVLSLNPGEQQPTLCVASHALRVVNSELAMLSAWFTPPKAGRLLYFGKASKAGAMSLLLM